MRLVALLLLSAGVLLAATGCNPVDKHYFTRGVGTDLYPDDVANQTQSQNAYVADICRQAGLVPTEYDGTTNCGSNAYDPAVWWQFVQAGMNDIDRRCDAYLTWLDNVRRSREPILNQISQTGAVTQTILAATGVGVNPMAIVAAAFGLASSTFTNVNSRLITELDHSTVQAVVLSKQTEYRKSLIGDAKDKPKVIIASRPAAIYALRSYLRLCMPMTIETEINNTVATIARSGPDALSRKQPLISAQSVGTPLKASQKITRRQRPTFPPTPGYDKFIENYDPKIFTPPLVKQALKKLCVQDVSHVGADTVPLVQVYQMETGQPPTGKLSFAQMQRLTGAPTCPAGRLNYYEAHGMPAGLVTASNIALLNAGLPEGDKIQGTPDIKDVRTKYLPKVRSGPVSDNLILKSTVLAGQFTRDLMTALFRKMQGTQ